MKLSSRCLEQEVAFTAHDFELASELLAHEPPHILLVPDRACVDRSNSDEVRRVPDSPELESLLPRFRDAELHVDGSVSQDEGTVRESEPVRSEGRHFELPLV